MYDTYAVRYMRVEEDVQVKALKEISNDKIVSEFLSLWTLWDNWRKHPPVVTLLDGKVVGFHAHTYSHHTRIINSYFQWLHPDHRGMRLGGEMVDYYLEYRNDAVRLKFRTPTGSDGYTFWTGFGLVPIGHLPDKSEYLFDLSLIGVAGVADLIKRADELCAVVTTDKRTITNYRKLGVVFTHPAWRQRDG